MCCLPYTVVMAYLLVMYNTTTVCETKCVVYCLYYTSDTLTKCCKRSESVQSVLLYY